MTDIPSTRNDLTGKRFGDLEVIKDSGQRYKSGEIIWECQCNCENHRVVLVQTTYLTSGYITCCKQILNMTERDLTGMIFGRWKVLKRVENGKDGRIRWLCECQCKKKTLKTIPSDSLRYGHSKSCGCINIEKRRNKYDLTKEYGIGWTANTNKEFYFDLEDYDKIKDYRWQESDSTGYVMTFMGRKHISIHRLIMGVSDHKIQVDHQEHNKLDNRKNALRLATNQENSFNKKVKGIYWNNSRKRWVAQIKCGDKRKTKYCKTQEEAIYWRKIYEEELFGEYSYDASMKLAELVN